MTDAQSTPTDEELVAGMQAGNSGAASLLTERYWAAIQRYCRQYLHDEQLAEDVAQETFAKLVDGTEPPAGMFKPWIYKVARNRCIDALRRFNRSPTHHNRLHTAFDAAGGTSGPGTKAHKIERRELIRHIIQEMPDDYRDVLMLKFFEGFSRAEMAESLGVSEQAVKGRLVRASQFLEEELRKLSGLTS
ncbi:MAG: RNA polymerase sigma factor [Phycisphaerae bacterium]